MPAPLSRWRARLFLRGRQRPYNMPMNRRRLYLILAPHSPGLPARIFRTVHHSVVAAGIAVMLAATVASIHEAYEAALEAAFYAIAAFFLAEYVLRLFTAPERPGGEHYGELRGRLTWAISLGG